MEPDHSEDLQLPNNLLLDADILRVGHALQQSIINCDQSTPIGPIDHLNAAKPVCSKAIQVGDISYQCRDCSIDA